MMDRKKPEDRLLITVDEVARLLGIGRDLAYRLARTQEIPSIRLGRRLLVPRQAMEDWIERAASSGRLAS